jgi:hypothetical protein
MSDTLKQAQQELLQRRPTNQGPQTAAGIAAATLSPMVNGRTIAEPLAPPPQAEIIPSEPTRLDTLDVSWHPMVAEAVSMARTWQRRRRQQIQDGRSDGRQ